MLCMGTSSLHRLASLAAKPGGFKIYNEIIPRPNQKMWPLIRRMDGLIGISKFNCGELRQLFSGPPHPPGAPHFQRDIGCDEGATSAFLDFAPSAICVPRQD